MNSNLKKAFFAEKRSFNEYQKNRNSKTWETYRAQRNVVNKLKKKSINTYFQERCIGGAKSETFGKLLSHICLKGVPLVSAMLFFLKIIN